MRKIKSYHILGILVICTTLFLAGCGQDLTAPVAGTPVSQSTQPVPQPVATGVPTGGAHDDPMPVAPLPVPTAPLPVTTSASIPASTTPTFAPATVTALVRAHLTALVEQYGPSVPSPDEQAQLAESTAYGSFFTRPGTLIAQGTNTVPKGPLNLLTYRVEEVTLPGPTTFTRLTVGRTITVDRAWRVTITGGPFGVNSSTMYHLLINGGIVAKGGTDTAQLVFLVFDRGLLKEGSTLGVAVRPPSEGTLPDSILPEQLHFLP